jgi:hypothetical protein
VPYSPTLDFSLPLSGPDADFVTGQLPTICLPLSTPLHVRVGGFNRQAQAAYYASQVLNHVAGHDAYMGKCHSNWLNLDLALQTLLRAIMDEAVGDLGMCCEAVALTIRYLSVSNPELLTKI